LNVRDHIIGEFYRELTKFIVGVVHTSRPHWLQWGGDAVAYYGNTNERV
jgi:hypothetical protein